MQIRCLFGRVLKLILSHAGIVISIGVSPTEGRTQAQLICRQADLRPSGESTITRTVDRGDKANSKGEGKSGYIYLDLSILRK